jgi:hypothetical protein
MKDSNVLPLKYCRKMLGSWANVQIYEKMIKKDVQMYDINKPFFSYRLIGYSKYHRPTSFGFELEVQTLRNISRPLKTSCRPYSARGNVSCMHPMSLSHLLKMYGLDPALN